MAIGTTTAIIAAAVIGAASAKYSADEQKFAAKRAEDKREGAAAQAQAEADRIAAETKPEEEGLEETRFGAEDEFGVGGSTQEFLVPKSSALGGSATGRSGLGFKV